jgi:hypothetical protein
MTKHNRAFVVPRLRIGNAVRSKPQVKDKLEAITVTEQHLFLERRNAPKREKDLQSHDFTILTNSPS